MQGYSVGIMAKAESVKEEGLGVAIMDRLRKAAAREDNV